MGDSPKKSVHQISRGRKNKCLDKVAQLVYKIQGDKDYLHRKWDKKSNWEKRTKLVTEVMEKVEDPQFEREPLRLFPELNNPAPNRDRANEILESNELDHSGVLQMEAKAMQMEKVSQSMNDELNQLMAIVDQKDQVMKNVNVYVSTSRFLQYVVNACSAVAEHDILNLDSSNQVPGSHGVGPVPFEIEKGKLTLNFPPTPVHNQEKISEEKETKEVTLIIRSEAGRVVQLKLTNPETLQHPLIGGDPFPGDFDFDIELPYNLNTCTFQNYKVFEWNGDVLKEIFEEDPTIAENFKITNPDLQSDFMNTLAELYQNIKSEKEKLKQKLSMVEDMELNDLQSIIGDTELKGLQSKIQDMEHNGLRRSLLEKKLEKVRELKSLLERSVSRKDRVRKDRQEEEEDEPLLAKFKKKQRN